MEGKIAMVWGSLVASNVATKQLPPFKDSEAKLLGFVPVADRQTVRLLSDVDFQQNVVRSYLAVHGRYDTE